MDTIPIAAHWPKHPYRGLDFYSEMDALLFRERNADVSECSTILLGFGVKILLLQGSSGSGKSSFLRAGLIPRLKQSERRNFFLSGGDGVIRCTSDPLPKIAQSLIVALNDRDTSDAPAFFETDRSRRDLAGAIACRNICGAIEGALQGPRDHLAEVLAGALVEICGELAGRLILVLDQAEEVLTRHGGRAGEAAEPFFRFLEGIYLRNVDMRLVVALRTEYYGRFRDELRISDDRLGKRPRSGGVEPYLLRPLRERSSLLAIINAPTLARQPDGTSIYDFAFESGLAERIVDDLLERFQYASVTPALQVVCSSLYERLSDRNRTITQAEYVKRGRIIGIVDDYLTRGIAAAGARTKAQRDQWGELLYTLVSRQGGGTLVSLTEAQKKLEERAREVGIRGAIGPALARLTAGATPLLRGEPPEEPRNFSLKHDVLAVVLARWYAQHQGAVKATRALKRRALVAALALLIIGGFFSWTIWQHSEQDFQDKARSITLTDRHALRAPGGNFRQSLLLTLTNLDATATPSNLLVRLLVGDNRQIHDQTVDSLRSLLSRSPWFAGRFAAAGVDPAGGRVALLASDARTLSVLTLPSSGAETAAPALKSYALPERAAQFSWLRPAAGFVSGLGPAAVVGGRIFYWDERDQPGDCDVAGNLPAEIASGSWARADFAGGQLEISTPARHNLTPGQWILWLDAARLRVCASAISGAETVQVPHSLPGPVFADMPSLTHAYAYLEAISKPVPDDLSPSMARDPTGALLSTPVELDAVVSLPERPGQSVRMAVGQVSPERGIAERLHYTAAFAANAEAIAFKFDGPDFYIYDLASARPGGRPGYIDVRPLHVAVAPMLPAEIWRSQSTRNPWWVYPPFTAVRMGGHWRAAWLANNGVWVADSSDANPGRARLLVDNLLIGEPDGVKLQLTRDGQFLVEQQMNFGSPMTVRIWDLNSSWRNWIRSPKTTEQELRRMACRVVLMDGAGAFDEAEIELFQIRPEYREPCPQPTGAEP
jgi:hypothetical protein